jgi:hypothetical protein
MTSTASYRLHGGSREQEWSPAELHGLYRWYDHCYCSPKVRNVRLPRCDLLQKENVRLVCQFPSFRTVSPTAEVGPVTMRFGTTTVPDSESLNEVFSTCDILRRGVKANSAYRAGRQGSERDDEVPNREAVWRAGRRGRIAIEAARWRGVGRAPRVGRRNSLLTDGNGGKLPKSYRNLSKSISVTPPLLSKSLPNFGRSFRYRPVPLRNPTENFQYRNPLKSGLPNLK